MDYIYIVNAFKQQQQQLLLHQHQLQQQLKTQYSTTNTLSLQQQLDNCNMSNSLIWQPWRDFQQVAVHHHLYQQQQQKLQLNKETRLTSKELPTSTWRRERRLRTAEYHHPHNHLGSNSSTINALTSSPNPSPPPAAHNMHPNAQQISIMMAAAAAVTSSIRPSNESNNRPSPPTPPSHSTLAGHIDLGQIAHSQVLQQMNLVQSDDAPLDMSVGSLKQRNSPPPPYREPLAGSQFATSLPRPSVITQAPPKKDVRDSTLAANRENDNRSCESIDEHFRRSLGSDYFSLFSKRSTGNQPAKTPSPQPQNSQPQTADARSPSPTLPLLSGSTSVPAHSVFTQSELIPSPLYPISVPADEYQQNPRQAHQKPTLVTSKANAVVSSSAATTQIKIAAGPISPPLPLVVRPSTQSKHQQPIGLQKSSSSIAITPLTSPQSPATTPGVKMGNATQVLVYSTTGSKTGSISPLHQQQQQLAASVSLTHSPTSSPRQTPPNVNVQLTNTAGNLAAITRIKTEPGLQNFKSHNPTPPVSPTLSSNHNINSNSNTSPSPSPPTISNWKSSTNSGNTSAEVLASVDDHFAKALGDTWKKLQENKDIRK